MTREQILVEAMALELSERESLAEDLLLSASATERDEIDQAWLAEVREHDAALGRGKSTTSTVDEVIERVLSRKRP